MREIHLTHLYPAEMNIYGDTGNLLTLRRRLEWRGYQVKIHRIGAGEEVPHETDILLAGGGQDKGQSVVQQDLGRKKRTLLSMRDDGVVMLAICGTYQLFGHRFITGGGAEIKGIGLFDLETRAGRDRLIGNIVIATEFGELVGYENHSGRTYLGDMQMAFGRVKSGAGNNGSDKTEGAVTYNCFGSYLHGPLLPKNPAFADELLRRAIEKRYGHGELEPLDDTLAEQAALAAKKRPR